MTTYLTSIDNQAEAYRDYKQQMIDEWDWDTDTDGDDDNDD